MSIPAYISWDVHVTLPITLHVRIAANAFNRVTGFDVEELAVDLFYWFDMSSK